MFLNSGSTEMPVNTIQAINLHVISYFFEYEVRLLEGGHDPACFGKFLRECLEIVYLTNVVTVAKTQSSLTKLLHFLSKKSSPKFLS